MEIEGGCLCGKVRYSAEAEPAFVAVCHCKNCQRGTGTAFASVLALPKPALRVTGASRRRMIAATAARSCLGAFVRSVARR
jgi:hypothetical protein